MTDKVAVALLFGGRSSEHSSKYHSDTVIPVESPSTGTASLCQTLPTTKKVIIGCNFEVNQWPLPEEIWHVSRYLLVAGCVRSGKRSDLAHLQQKIQ